MTPSDKKQLRSKITEDLEAAQAQVSSLNSQIKPVEPSEAIGRLTRLEAINDQRRLEASLADTHRQITLLQIAEARLDDEDFGQCAECDQPIPIGRLMLLPHSQMCVRCKEEGEG